MILHEWEWHLTKLANFIPIWVTTKKPWRCSISAIGGARRAADVAGEGMAWGNLSTVNRALKRFQDAIDHPLKYRDNAERRMDIGGVAIMQHQLAMDYFLFGKLLEAERSVLDALQTLES